ncbi:MAG: methionyl-tRNA formyltransferase [Aquificaceae bacterium]|nr:methionyl-tRNA formyltransferase [Aquificaceae bacterium]MDW8096725.1 methionyl-tRNA formyltransferase [Aquificaceae bacterium]
MRLLFFGTPQFAVPSLQRLAQEFEVAGVVCQPDRPAGRGQRLTPPPVKVLAQGLGLPVFQPEKKPEIAPLVQALDPQCVVVVAYGKILPPEVVRRPPYGCINLHASLLPRYRGSAPIQRALMAGESVTGNTVMLMEEGMDAGPILSRQEEQIDPEDNLETLSERLAHKGAELLLSTLKLWFEGKITPEPQEHSLATYAPPVSKEELRICWKAQAQSVKDRVRGLYPNCYAYTDRGERVKVLKVRVVEGQGAPGELIGHRRMVVACGQGAVEVLELISPKGRRMSGEDFLRGYSVRKLL